MALEKFKHFFNFKFPENSLKEDKPRQTQEVSEHHVEQEKISKKVDALIGDTNTVMLSIFINNDYVFKPEQLKKMLLSGKEFSFDEKTRLHLYQTNWEPLYPVLHQKFKDFGMSASNILKQYPGRDGYNIDENYKNTIDKHFEVSTILSEKFTHRPDAEQISEIYYLSKKHRDDISDSNRKGGGFFADASTVVNKINAFHQQLQELFNKNHEELFAKMAQRSRALDSLKNNISDEISSSIAQFDTTKLPPEAQQLLESIEASYQSMGKQNLTTLQKLDVANLYSKRLPQVVGQYAVIPEAYRKRLENDADSPDKLVVESLLQINEKMNQIVEDLFQPDIQNMKKTKQYLKTM